MRIANGAVQAAITLRNEANVNTLKLTAKDAGITGNDIRAVVSYATAQPEVTFNLELFRWVLDSSGQRIKKIPRPGPASAWIQLRPHTPRTF